MLSDAEKDEIVEKFRMLWCECPEMSLGQVLASVVVFAGNPTSLDDLDDTLIERGIGNFHLHIRRGQPVPKVEKKRKGKKVD